VPFPFSINGQLEVKRRDTQGDLRAAVQRRAENALRPRSGAVTVQNDQIVFTRAGVLSYFISSGGFPFGFVVDRIALKLTDRGDVVEVSYELGTKTASFIVTGMMLFTLVWLFLTGIGEDPSTAPIPAANIATVAAEFVAEAVVGWLWLFGGGYLFTRVYAWNWLYTKLTRPGPGGQ
jgi:hypothetical protein